MKIHRGDQYALPFTIETLAGAITPDMIDDVRVKLGPYVGTYQQGTVLWDEQSQVWYIPLSQQLTRVLRAGPQRFSVGVRIENKIVYCDEQSIPLTDNQDEEEWPI